MGVVTLVSLMAALVHLLGGWLTLRLSAFRGQIEQVMALGTGFLLGTALLSLLPTALRTPGGPGAVTLGFGLFLLLRLLTSGWQSAEEGSGLESAWAVVAGILFHSLMEGVALGLAVQAGGTAGRLAVIALLLHKIPEGVSLATVFLSTGGSYQWALLSLMAAGLATLLGGWAGVLGTRVALTAGTPALGIAAGSFLYVGAAELLPRVVWQRGLTWLVLLGMLLVYLLLGAGGAGHAH